MAISLDATYSVGRELSGVGIYSREILFGLARAHPDFRFRFCYRPHRFLRSFGEDLPPNASRCLLAETWSWPPIRNIFHALNQRIPAVGFRRSVCTFHDLFVMTTEYSSAEFRARFAKQARFAAERAHLIITVSAFTADQVHHLLGVERSRLRVVHHGIRALPYPSVPREPLVLHTGAIQARKNTSRLVEAFERLPPPWRLVLAGSPTGYGSAGILARIENSSARSRIEVTGYISSEQLAHLYARASIFAFPSLDEGFGMPVLEAMAAGVPVITSNRSALPEIAGDAALLVDPFSADAIANALLRLSTGSELARALSCRGRQRATEFSWERALRLTWQVYQELECL